MILTLFNKIILSYGLARPRIFGYLTIPAVLFPLLIPPKTYTSYSTSSFSQAIFNDPVIIEFKVTTISFGTVEAGKKIIKEFNFKNTGTDSLRISAVQASDGGTMAQWPEKAIPPGAKNVIKVEFGFTGSRSGYQDKEFRVISNAQNNPVVLHLTGIIKKKD